MTFNVTCKPFAYFPRGEHKILVMLDGEILVFDDLAGHYTRCHSLSARSQARIRQMAGMK
jgi:hypothetical protein